MKKFIFKIIKSLGYEVKSLPKADTGVYKRLFSEDSLNNKRFYNIGAGNFYHPYWTNVDFYSDWYKRNDKTSLAGIHHDLMSLKALPVESNSAEVVYSCHTVEHISDQAAQIMFNESYRILKPGGILRINTPNIDLEYRAYKDNDRDYFYWINNYSQQKELERIMITIPMNKASIEQIFLYHFASNVSTLHKYGAEERISDIKLKQIFSEMKYEDALNYCTSRCSLEIQSKYPGNHINWWNAKKMSEMLKKTGFEKVFNSGYGQSFSPIMRNTSLFDNTHPKISLYMEAIKPC
jgi:predicted SAM-dependent methyltransferase